MSNLDLTKNFAIVTLGVYHGEKQKYGVAFAALRDNPELFLVFTATSETSVSLMEINRCNLTFIHPKYWEGLFENNTNYVVQAYQQAYFSTPEDWPCGYVRTKFSGQSPTTEKVSTKA